LFFENALRIRANDSVSGVCLDIGEGIPGAGMQSSEGKRKGFKANRKGCKIVLYSKGTYTDVVNGVVCFALVSPGVFTGEGQTHME